MYNFMERRTHATKSCSERSEMQTRRSQYDTLEQPLGATSANEVSTCRKARLKGAQERQQGALIASANEVSNCN